MIFLLVMYVMDDRLDNTSIDSHLGKVFADSLIYYVITPFWHYFFSIFGLKRVAELHNLLGFIFLLLILYRFFFLIKVRIDIRVLSAQLTFILLYLFFSLVYKFEFSDILYQLYYLLVPFLMIHLIMRVDNYSLFLSSVAKSLFIPRIVFSIMYFMIFVLSRFDTGMEAMVLSYALLPIALIGFSDSVRRSSVVSSVILCLMLIVFGNRGMFVCTGSFFLILILMRIIRTKRKYLYLSLLLVGALFTYVIYKSFIHEIIDSLYKSYYYFIGKGIRSEIIKQAINFVEKDLSKVWNDRDVLYESCMTAIKENPLGYGVGGSYYAMRVYYGAFTYPHQLFYEVLLDYGIIIGSLVLFFFVGSFIKLVFFNTVVPDSFVAVLIVCGIIKLLLSDSYLSNYFFWIFVIVSIVAFDRIGKTHKSKK